MMFDFAGRPTEEWYKWKMRTLGIKPVDIDFYKMESGCIICGRHELVYPLSGVITMCMDCFSNAKVAKEAYNVRVKAERHIALNVLIQNKCDVCHRDIKTGEHYYIVYDGRICTKCTWKKLGNKHRVLKVEGERMW